jgi:hypothetical protein
LMEPAGCGMCRGAGMDVLRHRYKHDPIQLLLLLMGVVVVVVAGSYALLLLACDCPHQSMHPQLLVPQSQQQPGCLLTFKPLGYLLKAGSSVLAPIHPVGQGDHKHILQARSV